jgi:tetratricopeptide (TPR) repeat protein
LVERYGLATLKRILVDLGVGMPINDALARYAGSLEAVDHDFAEFAVKRANAFAPDTDWSDPKLPPNAKASAITGWLEKHPKNYRAWQRLAAQLMEQRQWQAAQAPLKKLIELYPDNGGGETPYIMLAKSWRELDDAKQERAALEQLAAVNADNLDAFSRLTELAFQAEDWPAVLKYGERLLAINPLRPPTYRWLATAAQRTEDDPVAIAAWRALLALDPIDPAAAHYQLAVLLHKTGDLPAARREVLKALEEAPRYRAAQRELLSIVREMSSNAKDEQPATGVR